MRKSKRWKSLIPEERDEQIIFVKWLELQGYRFSASANGGSRNKIEAGRMKETGISAGYPDVFVPFPVDPYHGFYVEMKRTKNGKVSKEQKEWLKYLQEKMYYTCVAYGSYQAELHFEWYIKRGG